MMIHVCSLPRVHETVTATGASHLVTLLRDTTRLTRPDSVAADNHLILSLDDIVEALDGQVPPGDEHVVRLVEFVSGWNRAAPMVVHCFAGISRSTASAYVAACTLNPARDEMQIAQALRQASPTATPNARIVALADKLLKRQGRMIRAIQAIGPGAMASEGTPFRLDLA
jgi:predicted protein tyrosine phosphatase